MHDLNQLMLLMFLLFVLLLISVIPFGVFSCHLGCEALWRFSCGVSAHVQETNRPNAGISGREGVKRGAYVVHDCFDVPMDDPAAGLVKLPTGARVPDIILIGSGQVRRCQ